MSLDRILNMVIRQVIRIAVNKGVGAGINALGKRGKSKPRRDPRVAQQDTRPPKNSPWD
ncbi:hypothetical protein TRM7557_03040 [Tritonibacter multivorans]|uniref:Uncharacterized protein n=1 Tax=Tritonibacter multivorans TaxID=928856 RepID=A0A0P1GGH2_9RHOB|nr:hypothetical protein [Tritonibacter multivorans]MDA7420826.1 hypothetical protein [Tritonibacter multivorans]CUH80679.1 hypothetical protein TRM7557_03040 [Tritonibacter multivorans]SFC85468.1 hypothetical protein SAMN04488049_104323 [Tritonibacter multivorans]